MSANIEVSSAVPSVDRRTSTVAATGLAERWPDYDTRERTDLVPATCPACKARARWTHYRFIPGAPAIACGWCNHTLFVTERAFLDVRAGIQAEQPKAAAGKITRRVR